MRMVQSSVFLFFLAACSAALANPQFESLKWQLVESSDSVKVHGRGVEGLPNAREIKATMEVPQSPESLLALMVDYPNATTWRQRVKGVERAKTVNGNSWYINYVTDLPWPMSDRVAYLKCDVIREEETGVVTYAFESAPSEDGMTEQESLSGLYRFAPQKNGKTVVTYQVVIDSPVKVPDWLAGALIGDSFVTQMEMLRKAVANPRYSMGS